MSLWKREREIERDRQTENLERERENCFMVWTSTYSTEYLYNYSYILFTLIKYDDKIILIK